jgi:hypothetical protein
MPLLELCELALIAHRSRPLYPLESNCFGVSNALQVGGVRRTGQAMIADRCISPWVTPKHVTVTAENPEGTEEPFFAGCR